jgi:multidrug efflux pump subunit AcrB
MDLSSVFTKRLSMHPPPRRHLYDRPIGVLAVLLAILVLGGLAIPGMRIRLFTGNQYGSEAVSVSLGASGLSTREALDRVTRPAEEIIRSLPAAGDVESYTYNRGSSLQVQPAPGSTVRQLMTQLSQAFASHRQRFPAGMREPSINSWSGESQPLLVSAFDRGEFNEEAFNNFLERVLIPLVQGIPGVAKAEVSREGNPSVQVALNTDRLAALRLDSEKVVKMVNDAGRVAQSFPLPASEGALARERHVRVLPVPMTPETLPAMRLDGRVSLADVATIEQRNPGQDQYRMLVNGHPGETLTVYANADANVYRTSHEVARVIAQECAAQGMVTHLISNSHEAFDEIAYEIMVAAGWCAGFSFLFLLLFLRRWRVAILVCMALPLSLVMAAIAMAVSGIDLSLLSLIGFLLASGMVIDNAIVISESLLRARSTSDANERRVVLRRAANAVAMAIIVSTLTTVAMFLPVMVTGNNAGRMWLVALAAPIVWSLIASLLVALVLVPMAFARLYPNGLLTAGRTAGGHGRWLIATERWYGRWLGRILLRPVFGLTLTGLLLGIGLVALYVLPKPENRQFNDERRIQFRMSSGASMDQTAAVVAGWSKLLEAHRERLGIVCVLGYIWRNGGDLTIYLTPVDPLGRSSDDINYEILHILPPQPLVMLDEHIELARFAAREVKRKEAEAAEKLKLAKEKEAEHEKEKVTNEKGDSKQQAETDERKRGEKKESEKENEKEVTSKDELQITTLSFVLSAPDPRAVAKAHKRLNEVLSAEGGLLLDKQSGREQRERGPRSSRSSITLSLTRAAEEQGWAAESVAGQMVRFAGDERPTRMPGDWWLGFGRDKTTDLTLSRLLETVVYQPANTPARAGTMKSNTNQSSQSTSVAPGSAPSVASSKTTTTAPSVKGSRLSSPSSSSPAIASPKSASSAAQKDPIQAVNAPLLHLVQPSSQPQESYIHRRNGLTQKELMVNIRMSERKRILSNFPALLARAHIPDGVEVRLAEQGHEVNDGVTALWIAMVTAAAVIYLLMCILYESLLAPLTVMTTVPAGIISVMGVFTIADIPMDPMVVLGLFLLVGIVINHGVVLVDRLGVTVPMHRLMRPDGKASHRALLAMAAASRRRFTPVVLTSLTTIAAAVPMTFSPGRIFGAPISSLGLSLSIGLTAATVFTLIVVPIVYQWLGLTRAGMLALLRGGRSP